jgi:Arc/MetJ-type ribon-helix-helix transcriptional regulator
LPERLAAEVEALVKAGWCSSEAEVIRQALLKYLQRHRLERIEQVQREDIAWALREKISAE